MHRRKWFSTGIVLVVVAVGSALIPAIRAEDKLPAAVTYDLNIFKTTKEFLSPYTAAFTPDGQSLAVGLNDGSVRLWDLKEKKFVHTFSGPAKKIIHQVAVSRDGKWLAAASWTGEVYVWNLATPADKPVQLPSKREGPTVAAISNDGESIATGTFAGKIYLWNSLTGELRREIGQHKGHVACVAFSPSQSILASGGNDGIVRLWDLENPGELQALPLRTEPPKSESDNITEVLVFDSTGKQLAAADWSGQVHLWNLTEEKKTATFNSGQRPVFGLCIHPSLPRLVSASRGDGTIRLWDLSSNKQTGLLTFSNVPFSNIYYSPDGKTLAACGFNSIYLIDAERLATESDGK